MKAPQSIIGAVETYLSSDPVSFHVPGHKNGRAFKNSAGSYTGLDVTEIPGTDNLHHPSGAIQAVQERAAKAYGALETYFLVNGTTCGNHAMILGSTRPGDKILLARNVHKSVHTACIIGHLNPVYVYPQTHDQYGLTLGLSPKAVEKAFADHPDAVALVMTSPTYEGVHSNISAIADIVHRHDALLLVDEAHGAHLVLSSEFGRQAIACGADVAVQSTHKSMNALTQASMLHIGSERANRERIRSWLAMLQSSSPSYVLMASLESAVHAVEDGQDERVRMLLENLATLRLQLERELGLEVLGCKNLNAELFDHDPSKLVIFVENGELVAERLREAYAIQVEYASHNCIVCVCSIWNSDEDFCRLFQALSDMSVLKAPVESVAIDYPDPLVQVSPQRAFYGDKVVLPLSEAVSQICAEYVIPYPPGIPVLSPGEVITEEIAGLIENWRTSKRDLVGMHDRTCKTIQVIRPDSMEAL